MYGISSAWVIPAQQMHTLFKVEVFRAFKLKVVLIVENAKTLPHLRRTLELGEDLQTALRPT